MFRAVSDANPGPGEIDLGGAPSVLIAPLALVPRGSRLAAASFVVAPGRKRVPSLLLSTAARDPGKDLGMGY